MGIIHDENGLLKKLGDEERAVYDEITHRGRGMYTRIRGFQENLVNGEPNDWRCRAGARYLYICEDGLVHYCSQMRGFPGIPLQDYTVEHIIREFDTPKTCAPYCTIGCVHRASFMDAWRPQKGASTSMEAPSQSSALVSQSSAAPMQTQAPTPKGRLPIVKSSERHEASL
ncbi:MAG: hypothetical protein R3C68_02845 [Myxococcota bacterium]